MCCTIAIQEWRNFHSSESRIVHYSVLLTIHFLMLHDRNTWHSFSSSYLFSLSLTRCLQRRIPDAMHIKSMHVWGRWITHRKEKNYKHETVSALWNIVIAQHLTKICRTSWIECWSLRDAPRLETKPAISSKKGLKALMAHLFHNIPGT